MFELWTQSTNETAATIHAADFARHMREANDWNEEAIDARANAINHAEEAEVCARDGEHRASGKAQTLSAHGFARARRAAVTAAQRAHKALLAALCLKSADLANDARALHSRCIETQTRVESARVAAIGGAQ